MCVFELIGCLFPTVRKRHASESQIDDNDTGITPLVKRRRTVSESTDSGFNQLRKKRLEAADEQERESSTHVTDEGTKSTADKLLAGCSTEADFSPRKDSDLKRRRKEKRTVSEESDCPKIKRQKADHETYGDQENGSDGALDMAETNKPTKKVKISNERQEMFMSSDRPQTQDELKKNKKKKKAKDKTKVKDIPELRVISKYVSFSFFGITMALIKVDE